MIVTVFRSRLNPDAHAEYQPWAEQMSKLASTMPGYLSHKTYAADDGERVTIVEFESEETQREWAHHPLHVKARQLGREKFYSEYRIQVCEELRATRYPMEISGFQIKEL